MNSRGANIGSTPSQVNPGDRSVEHLILYDVGLCGRQDITQRNVSGGTPPAWTD